MERVLEENEKPLPPGLLNNTHDLDGCKEDPEEEDSSQNSLTLMGLHPAECSGRGSLRRLDWEKGDGNCDSIHFSLF